MNHGTFKHRSWATRARIALQVACLFVGTSCSPVVRVRSHIVFPPGVGLLSPERLHVTAVTSASPGPLPPPPPTSTTSAGQAAIETTSDGFDVELRFHGQRFYVNVTAWYDTNGNDVVDTGDALGTLSPGPIFAEDKGLFSGNVTTTPPILTKSIP